MILLIVDFKIQRLNVLDGFSCRNLRKTTGFVVKHSKDLPSENFI